MSRIKTNTKPVKRAALNTTITADTLLAFKNKTKMLGINMNVIIECMMTAFIEDEIVLKVGKNNRLEVDVDE